MSFFGAHRKKVQLVPGEMQVCTLADTVDGGNLAPTELPKVLGIAVVHGPLVVQTFIHQH